MSAGLRRSVASLHIPNYRRFFVGQIVSITGNWMQNVAEMWLVLQLTHSGTLVGLTAAAQFLPMLLAGAWGGLLADRVDKRRLLMVTNALMTLPPLALVALVETGDVAAWMVIALVFARGMVTAVDNPARQSFVIEMVGPDRVVSAVSLNSVIVHASRIAGPAGAAAVIALGGVAPCFALNALSFVVMIVALRGMDRAALHPAPPVEREEGQLRAALRHVAATPELRVPLAMMAVVGTLSFNFPTLLPLIARFTFDGSASSYAALTAALAAGSIAGALTLGARRSVDHRFLSRAALVFGLLTLIAAAAPTYPLMLAALVPVGLASVAYAAGSNSAVQLAAAPELRGRVMALYGIVFLGSTPIGAPIVGWVAETAGPRWGLVIGGLAALLTGLVARAAIAYAARNDRPSASRSTSPARA
ncbi:MAG TPA: MFS transporter [Capillimicrobium sp.]|nr:MFS transporter [Capillimicrobium sp.]